MAAQAKRALPEDLRSTVRPYRGGFLAKERRQIEADLFEGRLRGVAATTALELGVDVGGLDACILNGFPGTIASMWQQAGRAGREAQQSLAVLVAGDDQLDQWLMAHPTEVFSRAPEPAQLPSTAFSPKTWKRGRLASTVSSAPTSIDAKRRVCTRPVAKCSARSST